MIKSLLYHYFRGIVDASYSNENIIIPALDLLCAHLETLPDISRQSYIESVKTTTIVLEPLPELIQVSRIIYLVYAFCPSSAFLIIHFSQLAYLSDYLFIICITHRLS